jgi:hypothetical protein
MTALVRRRKRPPAEEKRRQLVGRLRIGELNRIFGDRYGGDRVGYELPDDDAGRGDLEILLQHYANSNPHKLHSIAKLRAPWMEAPEIWELVEQIGAYPRQYRAKTLGSMLRVTRTERQSLNLRTIAAIDMTASEQKQEQKRRDRLRRQSKRRAQGKPLRAEYLADSISQKKPWEAEGISRRTWYRRHKSTRWHKCVAHKARLNTVDIPVPSSKRRVRKEGGRAGPRQAALRRPEVLASESSRVTAHACNDEPLPFEKSKLLQKFRWIFAPKHCPEFTLR